jgi:hypothetical protein
MKGDPSVGKWICDVWSFFEPYVYLKERLSELGPKLMSLMSTDRIFFVIIKYNDFTSLKLSDLSCKLTNKIMYMC